MLQHMQMQQQGQMGDQIDHDQMNEMVRRLLYFSSSPCSSPLSLTRACVSRGLYRARGSSR
jgi:hypothetical protein